MRIVGGYQDTRLNKEDFAITPFLFLVWFSGTQIKVYGIGFCWGFYSVYLGLGFGIPRSIPNFIILGKQDKEKHLKQ